MNLKKTGAYPMLSPHIPIVSSNICSQWYLAIQETQVIGHITKNEKQQYVRLLQSKQNWNEAEKKALHTKIKAAKKEKMTYVDFIELLKRKGEQLKKNAQE